MNVIKVPTLVLVIADEMLPEPALPDTILGNFVSFAFPRLAKNASLLRLRSGQAPSTSPGESYRGTLLF